jgi:hypothetical protein
VQRSNPVGGNGDRKDDAVGRSGNSNPKQRGLSLVPLPVPLQADKTSNQPLPTPGRSWGNALKSEKLPGSED